MGNADDEALRRRRERTKLYLVSGYSQREMTDAFIAEGLMPGHNSHPAVPPNQTCPSCYAAVRKDVRRLVDAMDDDAGVVPGAARWIYVQRMERLYRDAIAEVLRPPVIRTTTTKRLNGDGTPGRVTVTEELEDRAATRAKALALALDAAERSALAQGVDTRRPAVAALRDEWVAVVDQFGILRLERREERNAEPPDSELN
jgi:hypothetical protein